MRTQEGTSVHCTRPQRVHCQGLSQSVTQLNEKPTRDIRNPVWTLSICPITTRHIQTKLQSVHLTRKERTQDLAILICLQSRVLLTWSLIGTNLVEDENRSHEWILIQAKRDQVRWTNSCYLILRSALRNVELPWKINLLSILPLYWSLNQWTSCD